MGPLRLQEKSALLVRTSKAKTINQFSLTLKKKVWQYSALITDVLKILLILHEE